MIGELVIVSDVDNRPTEWGVRYLSHVYPVEAYSAIVRSLAAGMKVEFHTISSAPFDVDAEPLVEITSPAPFPQVKTA